MLTKPTWEYPLTAGKSYVCLEEGQYRAYLDFPAALELLFDLYWLAKDQPIGEDIGISTHSQNTQPGSGKPIDLCEIHLIPNRNPKKQRKAQQRAGTSSQPRPSGVYTEAYDRLDYFVTPDEVAAAYEALWQFLQEGQERRRLRELTLFTTLVIRLLPSREA